MKSEHTPTPWHWSNEFLTQDGRPTWTLVGARPGYAGFGILSCDGIRNSPQGVRPADGDFILRACNAHDSLVAALERANVLLGAVGKFIGANHLEEYEVYYDGTICDGSCLCDDCNSAVDAINAALKLAKEGNDAAH